MGLMRKALETIRTVRRLLGEELFVLIVNFLHVGNVGCVELVVRGALQFLRPLLGLTIKGLLAPLPHQHAGRSRSSPRRVDCIDRQSCSRLHRSSRISSREMWGGLF